MLKQVANCTVEFIDAHYNASFMWTAKNQIEEKWDYIKAYDLGLFDAKKNTTQYWRESSPNKQDKVDLSFIQN